jgi:hypothetical protein
MKPVWYIAAASLLFAGVAYADTREYEKAELARYQRYAGEPIDEFTMFDLWQWQVLAPDRLVVWSTIHDLYLIRVDKACNNLEWTHGLSLTQEMRVKVTQKFDFVVFKDQRCKITEIRPIDYKAMLKNGDAKAAKGGKDAPARKDQVAGGT